MLIFTRCISWSEGLSFLILLGIAMPLKYVYNEPLAVRIVGMAHGILFIVMLIAIAIVIRQYRLKIRWWAWGFIAALLPFGPFIFDHFFKRQINRTNSPENSQAN